MLESVRNWLHNWGDLLLTCVIAWAAVMQWIVGKRLYDLQRAVESSHSRVKLFCRIAVNLTTPKTYGRLQISNLSGFPVWLESISHKFTLEGESHERELPFAVQEVLDAGGTYTTTVSGNIQSFLQWEEKEDEGGWRPALKPTSCTVKTLVNYWANGSTGATSTPQYRLRVSGRGIEELVQLDEN